MKEIKDNQENDRLFPASLLHATWQKFAALGYTKPVTGVVYRGEPKPSCGVPLGGVDTGCIDIDPNGMLGYNTIFNHLIRPRLLLNQPFLGLVCGEKTWVLVSDTKGKEDTPRPTLNPITFPPTDYTPRYIDIGLSGAEIAEHIDYWGHYPIADMEYHTSAPVEIGLRAWSPFIPGDEAASMVPGAIFEVHVRNPSDQYQKGRIVFSFPGFEIPKTEGSKKSVRRQSIAQDLNGVLVESGVYGNAWEMAYVLGVLNGEPVRIGGPLNADGKAWASAGESLPEVSEGETGASLAFSFKLLPGEVKVYRLVFAWHAPNWNAGGAPHHEGTNIFTHRYANCYHNAMAAAKFLNREHVSLLKRIIRWQEAIYQDETTPGWLADSLINILHLIPETSIWGQAKAPVGDWCREEDGLFALNECPRGCPQFECIPCSFYGNIPVVYFYPKAALSTLRGYKAYQYEDGRPPWIFGGITATVEENRPPYEISKPDKGYQTVLNGACYIVMADRYWRTTVDDEFLKEFWDSLKRCNDFSMNLRPEYGLSQVMAMPTPGTDTYHSLGDTEWFEAPEPGWKGYVTHAGAVRMAQVAIMRRMAEAMNDEAYLKKCDDWLKAGADAMEEKLWAGKYYLNFNEPETGLKSDLIFGYQLDGQWITDWHGVPGVFPKERVEVTLKTLQDINCALSQSGAVNYANPDGSPAKVGGYGTFAYFPPELFMLAMTFIYEGKREFGLDLLHRCMENVVKWGYVWDFPNLMRGDMDSGQRAFGADYYQNMMLWGVPAALEGGDLAKPVKDGLVRKVIDAGN